MKALQQNIINWSKEKGIDNAQNQRLKVLEEIGEVAGAILRGNRDEILMEIGDVAVTIIILHRLTGVESLIDVQYVGEVEADDPTESLMWIMRLCEYSIVTKEVDNLAAQFDSNLEECLTMAWNKIKDRQGKTVDGTFIKD